VIRRHVDHLLRRETRTVHRHDVVALKDKSDVADRQVANDAIPSDTVTPTLPRDHDVTVKRVETRLSNYRE